MPVSNSDKVRENRARRMAERQGLFLTKSRVRDAYALGCGRFALLDAQTRANVLPDGFGPTGEPNWTLEEIEAYLTTPPDQRSKEQP